MGEQIAIFDRLHYAKLLRNSLHTYAIVSLASERDREAE